MGTYRDWLLCKAEKDGERFVLEAPAFSRFAPGTLVKNNLGIVFEVIQDMVINPEEDAALFIKATGIPFLGRIKSRIIEREVEYGEEDEDERDSYDEQGA